MAITTNVPKVTFGPQGFQLPPESDVLNGVTADINAAFGGNVNPALSTPQGQIASSSTAIVSNTNQTFQFLTSQTDPAFAVGRWQDAIGRIYFIERNPSEPTTVQCICTGLNGVIIPVGALVQDEGGNTYACTQAGAIPITGNTTLSFANILPGPVPCPAGTLNIIYQGIPGWDTITNPSDGVIGRNVESQSAFETRRSASVAWNSLGSIPSELGAVLSVPNVISAYVTENVLSTSQNIGGVILAPNSLYVCVAGGETNAIAQAIWSRKAPGCAYNGDTTVQIQDTSRGYAPPFPTYSVTFQRAIPLSIIFSVVIRTSPLVPSNAVALIQNAIVAAFAGLDGGPVPEIGRQLFASRFYPTLSSPALLNTTPATPNPYYLSWAQVVDIQIGSSNAASAVVAGSINNNVLTVTSVTSGVLETGQSLMDAAGGITAGTNIIAFSSGSGGAGTYIINNILTVGSRTITAVTPNQFVVNPLINQIPTVSGPDIFVQVQ